MLTPALVGFGLFSVFDLYLTRLLVFTFLYSLLSALSFSLCSGMKEGFLEMGTLYTQAEVEWPLVLMGFRVLHWMCLGLLALVAYSIRDLKIQQRAGKKLAKERRELALVKRVILSLQVDASESHAEGLDEDIDYVEDQF